MASQTPASSEARAAIRDLAQADDAALVPQIIEQLDLAEDSRTRARADAVERVRRCRRERRRAGTLDAFLQEFGLSNREGIALMCLAEALLRVPDEDSADRLIAEKIQSGDWGAHRGHSSSRFVNASVWGLMLTGRIVRLETDALGSTGDWVQRLVSRVGEPVVRQAMLQAMRIMGGQYVLGRSIEEALLRGRRENAPGTRFSFDMLGEGARTDEAARRYLAAYEGAIRSVGGRAPSGGDLLAADSVSVKLSALHPRYHHRQVDRVHEELLPRLRQLAVVAASLGVGLSIDAEEAERLELSLDLFEALARDPELADWQGLGFVLQAYQKRAPAVADWLAVLSRETGRRIPVRLVKGAYWDSEIKHAQEQGLADYPVYTRKCHTDLSYLLCAKRLFAAGTCIYPQFATHNAHTVSQLLELGAGRDFEFQRLHGMGQLLYEDLRHERPECPVRVYAPVGNHRDLLPYLVRRLLENGANSSFVNRFLDERVAPEILLRDPVEEARSLDGWRHSRIPVPAALYAETPEPWRNARGIDISDPVVAAKTQAALRSAASAPARAAPIVGGRELPGRKRRSLSPADPGRVIGTVIDADEVACERALALAADAQPAWDRATVATRADCLERMAELLEARCCELVGLIGSEGGRTIDDALSEVREAIDFCRYYAAQARSRFATMTLPGPAGELNELSLRGRGVFLCISPWNFPAAIFTGQVAAALVAGNSVIAKPAEQTPLVAARIVRWFHESGVPVDVLHCLPGDGEIIGARLVRDPRVSGVAFTGGLEAARHIQRALAGRDGPIVPLIAETGGLNVMIADSTALPEQLVDDVVTSAFRSAGQRCSALRVLFLQADIAEDVLAMLAGALAELRLGDPLELSTDIGPVIDLAARQALERHCERMDREGRLVAEGRLPDGLGGYFFAPRVYEIDALGQLEGETFGPILHVIRYQSSELSDVIRAINNSGYGLTLGIHSRIDGFARQIFEATRVGNTYINRNMVGAVVGVQPFGGHGLSGTGPKAGGPDYLPRFAVERSRTDNIVARGGNAQLFNLAEDEAERPQSVGP